MVYQKSDGSHGFSWQQHYDSLLRLHPEDLENIVDSKLRLLQVQQPDKAKHYEDLYQELHSRINEAWDNNPNFGYQDSNDVVKAFVKDKGLSELFSDVPALSKDQDEFEDEDFDDELIDRLTEL